VERSSECVFAVEVDGERLNISVERLKSVFHCIARKTGS